MTTRESIKIVLKEEIKYILEELWRIEEDELLCKIFTRECMKTRDIQKVLRLSKEELNELSHAEDDDTVTFLEKHEV